MTGIENVNFRVRCVLAVAFRFADIEREIVLAPRSPAVAVASGASMFASLGRRPHWFGSRRTDHFESEPALVRSGMRTHRSKDLGRKARRSDRPRYGASSWLPATAGFCAKLLRAPAGPPRMPGGLPSSLPALRCAPQRPGR